MPPPPVLPPSVRVRVNGVESSALTETLLDFFVDDEAEGRATCRVSFVDWEETAGRTGFLHVDRSLLELNTPLAIEVGPPGAVSTVFDGRVTGIDGRFDSNRAPRLVVTAESRADLRAEPRTRLFLDMSLSEIVEAIAAEHGVRAVVTLAVPDVAATRTQTGEADLGFIAREAAGLNADTWLDASTSTLHVEDRRRRNDRPVVVRAGTTLVESSVQYRAGAAGSGPATHADVLVAGPPLIPTGVVVELLGVGPLHEGHYVVSHATHTFDVHDGFRSRVSGSRR